MSKSHRRRRRCRRNQHMASQGKGAQRWSRFAFRLIKISVPLGDVVVVRRNSSPYIDAEVTEHPDIQVLEAAEWYM